MVTLIRLPATPRETKAGRPIWNGTRILRVVKPVANRRKP